MASQLPDQSRIHIELTWKSGADIEVPDGMTREEAVVAFNAGDFHRFEDIDSRTAELTDWEAS